VANFPQEKKRGLFGGFLGETHISEREKVHAMDFFPIGVQALQFELSPTWDKWGSGGFTHPIPVIIRIYASLHGIRVGFECCASFIISGI
jgi:hypothetical protein